MLYQFLLYSKVNHLYIYIYLLFFRFYSHIGHYRVLSRVACAIQQVLISYLFYIQQCVFVNPNLPIYPISSSPLVTISLFSTSVTLFLFCKQVHLYHFLDSTYKQYHITFVCFYYIFLSLAALGLCCCAWAFSSCSERGLLFVAVHRLLLLWSMGSRHAGFSSCSTWAQQLWHTGSRACRLSSCGPWAQLLCGTWDLPGPGIEPVSPALAGGFLTTAPPGKSLI